MLAILRTESTTSKTSELWKTESIRITEYIVIMTAILLTISPREPLSWQTQSFIRLVPRRAKSYTPPLGRPEMGSYRKQNVVSCRWAAEYGDLLVYGESRAHTGSGTRVWSNKLETRGLPSPTIITWTAVTDWQTTGRPCNCPIFVLPTLKRSLVLSRDLSLFSSSSLSPEA